ncbi:hypothetical protein [Pseudonocardia lacus]|uniref:hypothetical protein n=1 Tax=Pseudonocardia lacus TaxID=2835865 RepID=UPI001BDC2E64|nr:hypothetical protein [Pseudonocardia lacus]
MRFQDETTTPREPTLAERRAREQARKRAEEAERAAEEDASRKKRVRRRVFVGTGVTVGVVAVIAIGYALAAPDDEIEAQCVDEETGVVVDDANCVTPAANPTYHGGGGGYFIYVGDGGRQYRYNYGGSGAFGSRVSGGTALPPKDGVTVRTSSGRVLSGGSSSTSSRPSSTGGTSAGSGSSSSDSSAGSPSVSRGGLGVNGTGSSSGS